MKKLYISSVLFLTVQLFLLLFPLTASYAVSPSGNSFDNLKTVSLPQEERHRVWLNLTSKEGIFKQLLIGYMTGATNGWDYNYDAVSMDANRFADFYSINERKKLVIQGRAVPLDLSDIIPLGYRSAIKGELTISIDHADGDLTNQDIYLVDKQTGTTHNLKKGEYTFITEIGSFNNRFEMRYSPKQNLGTHDFNTVSQELTVASQNKIININSRDVLLQDVSVFDITGKLLYSNQNIGTSDLEISNIQAGTQILLVKTILHNGNITTKKVFF